MNETYPLGADLVPAPSMSVTVALHVEDEPRATTAGLHTTVVEVSRSSTVSAKASETEPSWTSSEVPVGLYVAVSWWLPEPLAVGEWATVQVAVPRLSSARVQVPKSPASVPLSRLIVPTGVDAIGVDAGDAQVVA